MMIGICFSDPPFSTGNRYGHSRWSGCNVIMFGLGFELEGDRFRDGVQDQGLGTSHVVPV